MQSISKKLVEDFKKIKNLDDEDAIIRLGCYIKQHVETCEAILKMLIDECDYWEVEYLSKWLEGEIRILKKVKLI